MDVRFYCTGLADEGGGGLERGREQSTHVVVYGSKDLLGGDYQARHLPHGHLKVHLRELEEALEEAWGAYAAVSPRGRDWAERGI